MNQKEITSYFEQMATVFKKFKNLSEALDEFEQIYCVDNLRKQNHRMENENSPKDDDIQIDLAEEEQCTAMQIIKSYVEIEDNNQNEIKILKRIGKKQKKSQKQKSEFNYQD